MQAVKGTIPVYDICALDGAGHQHGDLMVERFASYLKKHPNLHRPHGHSFYHFVLFTKGGGFHTIDFNPIPVDQGQVYFMVPGQVHSWAFEGETDGYVVNFPEAFFLAFLSDPQYLERFPFFSVDPAAQVLRMPETDLPEAISILEQLLAELENRDAFQSDAVRLHLLQFFILVARTAQSSTGEPERAQPSGSVLQNFRRLVNQYYRQYKLPKDYAALLYVTPNYLNAFCQHLLGKSAGEVIRDRILLEAKRQLVNLNESVAGIGYSLGFTDNSYFTKFFKKYAGVTPEAFRMELQIPR